MRRIITMLVLVLHTADLPSPCFWGLLCRFVGFISQFPLSPLAKLCLVCFGCRSCPVFLSSCLVLLWLFCSGLTCFLLPSLVLLLFPLLVLFGIVRPSVGLVRAPSLVSVSIPVYLLLLLHCLLCVLVKVGDGMGDGFWICRWAADLNFWIFLNPLPYGDLNLRHFVPYGAKPTARS